MTFKVRRPILIGGIGLSLSLWLWESLDRWADRLDEFGLWFAITLGAGFWLFRQRSTKTQVQLSAVAVDREMAQNAIAQADGVISHLAAEVENHGTIPQLRQRVVQITAELDRQERYLTVMGGKAVGKTSLIQLLESCWVAQQQQPLTLKETPVLLTEDAEGTADRSAWEVAIASDLVLFVTNGDLTDSEWQILQQLKAVHQRTVLVFNKQDQYLPEDRLVVWEQLQQRMGNVGTDMVAIAAEPKAIKVRQHQADGSVREWLEAQQPEISPLSDRLSQILARESQQLVWATTWRAAIALEAEAKTALNGARRDRALPIIEQYQWIAAAAAFANPVPALDLLATGAINAQMVLDLSTLYRQKFSFQQAQTVAGTMGSQMVKLGLVELSTQTIGSLLKSNLVTFVAGGVVQGASTAYLTRIAGLSLIEYFQAQEVVTTDAENPLSLERLRQTLQTVFQQNQRTAFLQSFVKQVVGRLMPESSPPKLIEVETLAG